MRYFSLTVIFAIAVTLCGAFAEKLEIRKLELATTVGNKQSLSYPQSLKEPLTVSSNEKLTVTAEVEPIKNGKKASGPHQIALILVSETNEYVAKYLALAPTKKGNLYSASLDLKQASVLDSLKGTAGIYKASLAVAHFGQVEPVLYKVGSVNLDFPSFKWTPRSKSRTVREYNLEPLVEQDHQFRSAEKRTSLVWSVAFSGICLSPWLVLLGLWLSFGANLRHFSFNPKILVANMVFVGCIACSMFVYYLYFTKLNVFHTLAALCSLFLPTLLSGRAALRHHAATHPLPSAKVDAKKSS